MRRVVGLCSTAAVILAALPAAADWPQALHDSQRTAAAKGKGNLTAPVPTWRYRLGGGLYVTQALVSDADGDGNPEFFFIRGSGAVGRRLDDSLLWASSSMGVSSMYALADLDGNGKPELVVSVGTNQTAVFDALTGALDWLQPASEIGATSLVLVGDLTGDGLPEVLIQDCGCCGVMGSLHGAVYSFQGDAQAPKQLWQFPYGACGGAVSTTMLDVDGDGTLEVLLFRADGLDLLDGPTGKVRASLTYGSMLHNAQCEPAKLVPGAGQQAVCVYSNSTPDGSGHRAFAVGYTASPPALHILWDQSLPSMDGGLTIKPGLVADLDGDGQMEITVSAQQDAMTPGIVVLDAATGAQLGLLAGHQLLGAAPIHAGSWRILTQEGTGFAAWAFNRSATPSISPDWQLAGQSPLAFRDFALSTRCFQNAGLLATDVTGDGVADLVTQSSADGSLNVIDSAKGAAVTVASSPAPQNASLVWSAPTTVQGNPAFVTGWSDGLFRVQTFQNGALPVIDPPGVQFDGWYSQSYWRALGITPVVASLGGTAQSVLLTDASGTLHRLDASKADANNPPVEVWALPHANSPVIVSGLNGGAPGVVAIQRKPGDQSPAEQQIVALGADASVLWTAPLAGIALTDLVTGNFDGDGVPDVVTQWGATSETYTTLHTTVYSGASGQKLVDGKTLPAGLPSGAAIADWNGDGVDDVLLDGTGVHVLSGKDGSEISPPPVEMSAAGTPMLADVNNDGSVEVVVEGGDSRVTALSHDLATVLYASMDTQNSVLYGALARCPQGERLVEGTYFYHTTRLRLTDLSPPALGKETDMFLAGGQTFPDEASAMASGVFLGVLTAVSVHENLSGQGTPSALVGSSDGWLYAIDPCSGALEYTVNFKDAVGSVVFGDTDGDGLDEILVEVSDGYLYDLKQPPMPGTGGTGGASSSSGGGGSGGVGGNGGKGGKGGKGGVDDNGITGRATCACAIPGEGGGSALGLVLAAGLAVAATGRRRARRT